MDSIRWTDAAGALGQIAGAIGTLAGLIFLAIQLRSQSAALTEQRLSSAKSLRAVADQIQYQGDEAKEVAEQTRLQTQQTNILSEQLQLIALTNQSIVYQNLTKEMQEINLIFLRSPALRKYFYDKAPLPDDSENREQVCIMCEIFVDFISSAINGNALLSEAQRTVWKRYFTYIVEHSPGVQEYWRTNRDWYEPAVQEIMDPVVTPFE